MPVLGGLLRSATSGLQRRLIYLPEAHLPPVAGLLPTARQVQLRTSDGLTLGAWFVPAGQPARELTVVVANGNGGNRGHRAPLAAALAEAGFSVLLFDYRGYGGNPGHPNEQGLARDARAALTYLTTQHVVSSDRLLYFGESLGAAVVTELATEHPPAGLLLRSPFADLAAVAQTHFPYLPVTALLCERYPVAERIARFRAPTTVVYGTADTIVPPEQSRTVAAAAAAELVPVPGADHNDLALLNGATLIRSVVSLAERAGSA